MELLEKLEILGTAAKFDVCAASSSNKRFQGASFGAVSPSGVCHSFTPDGRCISLFKVLMTNECEQDCGYCQNNCYRDIPRARFTPDELVQLFVQFYTRNYVEGLFLSSGIRASSNRTMEDMLQVVERLRIKHRFGGYIHLKILPGCEESMIEKAVALCNRVSVNIEVPSDRHMEKLSRKKDFQRDILGTIGKISKQLKHDRQVTQTTQYVVGAAGETDREIFDSVSQLYHTYNLKRAYYSAYQPIAHHSAVKRDNLLVRENRLYQMDFLMRQYQFRSDEFIFEKDGNLNYKVDPKMAYAVNNMHLFPIDLQRATEAQLLRTPGIGPASCRRILQIRKSVKLTDLKQLKHMGVVVKRAAPFILLNGKSFGRLEDLTKGERPLYEQLTIEQFMKETIHYDSIP
ncbi:putative DNA modification/repair radical SAM protein [Geosporobacter subterraneus DSM 17957]|uniref:Putative DNA modification/repair radical SAM protein n=1 Tax=Geosporobacter subterraneus DSM 17957 TaxID=1121919 RepID=A0A1M6JUT3_9FIRM|nr:putative DNA modification/repair radical SAM protein [Geosporobacter subterraneus]SHJ50372.1 putative DNA modification/repair radical SAM protein [Geosporobacter subterraneus DSM 17957]